MSECSTWLNASKEGINEVLDGHRILNDIYDEFLSHIYKNWIGIEGKVDLRDESYVWTPKNWSFDKLREVGSLPTWVLFFI